jgi:hypothetical protein
MRKRRIRRRDKSHEQKDWEGAQLFCPPGVPVRAMNDMGGRDAVKTGAEEEKQGILGNVLLL